MATKRQRISPNGDARFVRRDARGRIVESDDVGRSLAQDRRRAAKATAKPGQGDKGDRKPATGAARKAGSATKKTTAGKSATRKSTASSATARKSSAGKATARKSTARKSSGSASTARKSSAGKSTVRKSAARAAPASSRGAGAAGPNAIQLLRDDHATVRGLLGQLEATTSRGAKTRTELLARIQREIEVHSTIEEEIFYPAFKAAGGRQDDDKMYFEALEEHRAAGDLVLPDLLGTDPASECFGGRAKVLKELIEHHAKEEEREMFPRARELLSADELRALGERMRSRKQELLAQPAPPKSIAGRVMSAVVGAIAPGPDSPRSGRRTATDGAAENSGDR
jgi:hypothetical protein